MLSKTRVLTAFALAVPLAAAGMVAGAQSGVFTFKLPGNPSTGYSWQLNEGASAGLDRVTVEVLGYDNSGAATGLIGAPAPFFFRATCRAAGEATLRFDYVSPDGQSVDQRARQVVACG